MKTIQDRLAAIVRDGSLTVADLSRWFGSPHSTVRQWMIYDTVPGKTAMERAYISDTIRRLEIMVRLRQGFPVPRMRPRSRVEYLAKLRARSKTPEFGGSG